MESNQNTLLESELDLQREDKRLGSARLEIYERVLEFVGQLGLTDREPRPRDSLVVRDDAELNRIKKTIEAYRGLREESRVKLPALKYAIAKLELATSEYLAAWKDFSSVAAMVTGGSDKGFAHFASFRAAMERRNWDAAMIAYLAAAKADPSFELFPMARYKPIRVLGTGAYGVSILCKDTVKDATVVVKPLWKDDLSRDVEEVFDEMRSLSQLDHPNIIRVLDCGSFNSSTTARPYIVMDYFEGRSLEALVREEGTLPSKDVIAIAIKVASAVQAGHVRNILHRAVKPGNVLVCRKDDKWDVRVIDFGLELRNPDMEIAAVSMRSPVGLSVAGTADSAAPEQLGKAKFPVAQASDIFGLAKTCCYALFQTPRPTKAQFNFLPKIITDVLDECLEKNPENRPESMKVVLDSFNRIIRDLQVSTRYVPAAGLRWSDERKEESPLERRDRLRREAAEREEYEDDEGDEQDEMDRRHHDRGREDIQAPKRRRLDNDETLKKGALERGTPKKGRPKKSGNLVPLLIGGGVLALTAIVVTIVVVAIGRKNSSSSDSNDQANNQSIRPNDNVGSANTAPLPAQDPFINKPQNPFVNKPPDPFVNKPQDPFPAKKNDPPSIDPAPNVPILQTRIIGGNNDPTFKEQGPQGALLVGFEVGMGKWNNRNVVINALRPIYRSGMTESMGQQFGPAPNNPIRVVAKPGYAVGAITVIGAAMVDRFTVTFMKIGDGRLNLFDSYESEWIGGPNGEIKARVGGNGRFVVGLIGKANAAREVTGMGLVHYGR